MSNIVIDAIDYTESIINICAESLTRKEDIQFIDTNLKTIKELSLKIQHILDYIDCFDSENDSENDSDIVDCYHDNNIEDRYDEKGNLKSNCDYCNQENCKERDADFVARD